MNSERNDECIDFTMISNFYEICRNHENLQYFRPSASQIFTSDSNVYYGRTRYCNCLESLEKFKCIIHIAVQELLRFMEIHTDYIAESYVDHCSIFLIPSRYRKDVENSIEQKISIKDNIILISNTLTIVSDIIGKSVLINFIRIPNISHMRSNMRPCSQDTLVTRRTDNLRDFESSFGLIQWFLISEKMQIFEQICHNTVAQQIRLILTLGDD
ncbi:hypothetical protein AGLY_010792 [Aphis glycines]|uniref:Uncharacterized protein n=1 Tax=Aphis glycines TaxID=307491 RepID=A0A6G0TEL1_APHGL|nr:hypothetical protein AGLY_010792 [Aphis glycines]